MTIRRYQPSFNRQQEMLLPSRVEDYVSQNNTVRAIDAYVNILDLKELGFQHTEIIIISGQPPFNPAALLKLYLYGYLQGIRSSRKLESETRRNLEVMWLVEGLLPTYKTIADFRKSNSAALKASNRDFLLLCKELSLFGGETVAVDGSFFKADASKQGIYTEDKLKKQLESLEKKITQYQDELDKQDATDDKLAQGSLNEDKNLAEKLALIKQKKAEKEALQQQLKDSAEKQISTVDEDARLLTKYGKTVAGHNVQIAVDAKHKLIVAEAVVQDGNDMNQLAPMLEKAQEILQSENLDGLGDSGYFNGSQIKACEDQNITVYVAVPNKSKSMTKKGRLTREQYEYDAEQDCYICPQGEKLTRRGKPFNKGGKNHIRYKSDADTCAECPLRKKCLNEKAKLKQIDRWEDEAIVDRHKQRMAENPDKMRQRSALAEHPFGILKHRAGMNHFLMRGLEKCGGEFSLMVLGYNFVRVINLLGVDFLRDYCDQRQQNGLKNSQYA
jgi:transposase